MIINYNIGKDLNNVIKYNIEYDRVQILNYVCANYINNILEQGDAFNITDEERNKLLVLINKLYK